MPPKEVMPGLALDSFSCPHCGAFADQHWFRTFVYRRSEQFHLRFPSRREPASAVIDACWDNERWLSINSIALVRNTTRARAISSPPRGKIEQRG
jgi:hypothetical protein